MAKTISSPIKATKSGLGNTGKVGSASVRSGSPYGKSPGSGPKIGTK